MAKITTYVTLCLVLLCFTRFSGIKAEAGLANQFHDSQSQGSFIKGQGSLRFTYPELFGDDAKATIVVFKATWCRPCALQATTVAALKAKGYRVRVYDIGEHKELYAEIGVKTIPYTTLLKDGEKQNEWIGVINWRYIARSCDASYKLE